MPRPANHLRDYQLKVLDGLALGVLARPGETFTVLFPRQAGKNEVQAWLVAWLLREHALTGGNVVIAAPTLEPQATISLNRLLRILGETQFALDDLAPARGKGHIVELGQASATFLSASPAAHVAGHTADLALIADEAQEIERDWFERQFRPMTASTGAPVILFGTPWDGETLLDLAVARNRERQAGGAGPYHFEVPWETVARANAVFGMHVRRERERQGADNPVFRSQYLLETVTSAGRMFSAEALAVLAGPHARQIVPVAGERYAGGLDLGGDKPGADATVLTVARLRDDLIEVVDLVFWRSAPFAVVDAGVVAAARRWGLVKLCVDATGMGAPLAARLETALGHAIVPVTFSEATKSELGFALLAAASSGRLAVYAGNDPDSATLWDELRDVRAKTMPQGALRWGNERGHDDAVVSLALAVRAASLAGRPRVAVGRAR